MDLRLFHPTDNPTIKYKGLDYHNSRTGLFACHTLEWTGWYTSDAKHRLLGHYRLYQIYKRRRGNSPSALPPVQGYILQYRSSYGIKYYWYMLISRLPSMFYPDPQMEMYWINKIIIYQRSDVLAEFLTNADIDFEKAFKKALQQINDPDFITASPATKNPKANVFVNLEQHNSFTHAHNELNIHPIVEKQTQLKEIIIKEPAVKDLAGKEKGVFAKRQVLILLDLLAREGSIDHLPLDKPAKTESFARFLMALTGKGIDTWLETLQNYRSKDLYAFHTEAERKNLLNTLETLATITRNAGLRKVAGIVDKKILQIEKQPLL